MTAAIDLPTANELLFDLGQLQRLRAKTQADLDTELAKIRERAAPALATIDGELQRKTNLLHAFCESNRSQLLKGDSRTVTLQAGEIAWRLNPPKVVIRDTKKAVAALIAAGLKRFTRAKPEIAKDAILKEPDAVRGIKGIKVEQGETWYATPTDAEPVSRESTVQP